MECKNENYNKNHSNNRTIISIQFVQHLFYKFNCALMGFINDRHQPL